MGADCYVRRLVCMREERGELVSRLVKFPSLFVANSGEFSEPWLWLAGDLTQYLPSLDTPPPSPPPLPPATNYNYHFNLYQLTVSLENKKLNKNLEGQM